MSKSSETVASDHHFVRLSKGQSYSMAWRESQRRMASEGGLLGSGGKGGNGKWWKSGRENEGGKGEMRWGGLKGKGQGRTYCGRRKEQCLHRRQRSGFVSRSV